jgi:predicted transcriptional regulator
MSEQGIENSPMEKWLRKKNMTAKNFIEMVGCSRDVISRVKRMEAISPKYAEKIIELTDGEVVPKIEKVGGRR